MPQRIQRKRTAGWRMPEGAVYVGRPSRWGNDFISGVRPLNAETRAHALALFEDMLRRAPARPELFAEIRADLGGKDLACWCPLDQPCHADVLLEIANGGVSAEDRREIDADSRFVDTQDAATRYQEEREA